jgi:hypothetical protein
MSNLNLTAKERCDAIETCEDKNLRRLIASKTRRTASPVTLSKFPGVKAAYATLAAEKAGRA